MELSSALGPYPEDAERLGIEDEWERMIRGELSMSEYNKIEIEARQRKKEQRFWRRWLRKRSSSKPPT